LFFCGEECRRRFAADPTRYAVAGREVPLSVLIEAEKDGAWWFG
jgi:hypothetical protein